ncbi:uncharacterized protein HKW66_Vig0231630 [Vigna angularis]|uniref:Aminotransferase-like plant mobile domain-containing protein n=1 Tax=Phaseolus angularis TaxID=3914 RepID=A0A8T0KAP4_PHAAN|nr:uncharacterized protein HKW66_Vig0231630 [Vigna angularis]
MRVVDLVGLAVQKLEPSVMEELGEQSKGRDRRKKLVFRHYCKTKMIGLLNERLTIEQKGYIEKSVFGLPIVGEVIDLNKVGHRSVCREYFPEGKVDVSMVYDFLLEEHENFPIEHFCSLYILVGILEFLLPNRSGVVFPIIFDLVWELGCVAKYNWGSLVFQYFVESVCSASTTMKNETSKSHIHVQGCAYLLQVWFCHHFVTSKSIYSTRVTKFPRLLNWIDMNIGDKFIKTALAKRSVVIDVGVSKEELVRNLLVEAKNEDKNEDFVEEPLWGSEDRCQSTSIQHEQQTPVFEGGFKMQQSTMYDRMKAQPRIRLKSVVKRSPYTAGVRRKQ